jgi:glycosyltransferase involved in cell wall biosynthesis
MPDAAVAHPDGSARRPPIRVLHLRNARGITTLTGPETHLLDLLPGLDPARVAATLVCSVRPGAGSPLFLGELRRRGAPAIEVAPRGILSGADYRAGLAQARERGLDLVQTHDARSGIVGWRLARGLRVPRIAFAHGWVNWEKAGSKEWLYAALEVAAVRRADRAIVASRDMERDLLGRGIPAGRIRYIPYGIDVARFDRRADARARVRAEFGIPAAAPLVGTVARFHPWKAQSLLVDAAAGVLRAEPAARFLLVGAAAFGAHAHYRDELEAKVRALGLAERVLFAGSRPDVPDLLNALDLFVLPSVREPFGIVSIEAQACGTPVIGARVGGIPETLEEGVSGLLVPPADPGALARAIVELLRDPPRRAAMGTAGRERVVRLFSRERVVEATTRLYEELADRRRAGGRSGA